MPPIRLGTTRQFNGPNWCASDLHAGRSNSWENREYIQESGRTIAWRNCTISGYEIEAILDILSESDNDPIILFLNSEQRISWCFKINYVDSVLGMFYNFEKSRKSTSEKKLPNCFMVFAGLYRRALKVHYPNIRRSSALVNIEIGLVSRSIWFFLNITMRYKTAALRTLTRHPDYTRHLVYFTSSQPPHSSKLSTSSACTIQSSTSSTSSAPSSWMARMMWIHPSQSPHSGCKRHPRHPRQPFHPSQPRHHSRYSRHPRHSRHPRQLRHHSRHHLLRHPCHLSYQILIFI